MSEDFSNPEKMTQRPEPSAEELEAFAERVESNLEENILLVEGSAGQVGMEALYWDDQDEREFPTLYPSEQIKVLEALTRQLDFEEAESNIVGTYEFEGPEASPGKGNVRATVYKTKNPDVFVHRHVTEAGSSYILGPKELDLSSYL